MDALVYFLSAAVLLGGLTFIGLLGLAALSRGRGKYRKF